jgi:hypothetical protein
MVKLADILIDRRGIAIWVLVVSDGSDEVWIPAFDEVGHVQFVRGLRRALGGRSIVANHRKTDWDPTVFEHFKYGAEATANLSLGTARPSEP